MPRREKTLKKQINNLIITLIGGYADRAYIALVNELLSIVEEQAEELKTLRSKNKSLKKKVSELESEVKKRGGALRRMYASASKNK